MTDATPSPRFTLHLSTALVLLFILAAFLGLALKDAAMECYGWPLPCYYPYRGRRGPVYTLLTSALACDLIVLLGVLGAVYTICEGRIRREASALLINRVSRLCLFAVFCFLICLLFVPSIPPPTRFSN